MIRLDEPNRASTFRQACAELVEGQVYTERCTCETASWGKQAARSRLYAALGTNGLLPVSFALSLSKGRRASLHGAMHL